MIWYCYCFLSGFKCTFSCIVQYSLYHNMDICTMWHCTLVSSTPSQCIGLVFGCALFWCWVALSAPVTISLIEFMIFMIIIVTIIGIFMAINYFLNFRLSLPKKFWFCKCTTPWLFPPLDILLENWIERVTFGLLGFSTGEFQALQLIVLVVFGAVD